MPRFYHTGIGLPPFEFVYGGTVFTIMPPDQHWMKVTDNVAVENIDGQKVKKQLIKWVVDNSNKTRPKKDYIDATDDMAKVLGEGRFYEDRKYIKHEADLTKQMDFEIENMQIEHGKKVEKMRASQRDEIAALTKK